MSRPGTAFRSGLLAVVMFAVLGTAAPQVNAGEYLVRQCEGAGYQDFVGQFLYLGVDHVDVVANCATGSGKVGVYQDRSGRTLPFGSGGQFVWEAPYGVELIGTVFTARLFDSNGISAQLVSENGSDVQNFDEGQPHDGQLRTTRWLDRNRPRSYVTARLMCTRGSGCGNASTGTKAFFEVSDVELRGRDRLVPTLDPSGTFWQWMNNSAWYRGTASINLTASDRGSGVSRLFLRVNGLEHQAQRGSCPGDKGSFATRLTPCSLSATRAVSVNLGASPFQQGANRVQVCAEDYALTMAEANRTCSTEYAVYVDSLAPIEPIGLTSEQGSSWQPESRFDLVWREPGGQLSPVTAAEYRVLRRSDGVPVSSGTADVLSRSRIEGIEVPEPGEYVAEVRLRDAAGNLGAAGTTVLRFDDGRPRDVSPELSDGWLSADDLPLDLSIERADSGGPSGVEGYAMSVSRSGPVDPCPSQRCLEEDLAVARGADERVVRVNDLAEGEHWVSTVAASGARLPSENLGTSRVKVDKTPPSSEISELPEGWVRGPVDIEIRAEDALSGMNGSGGGPDAASTSVQVGEDIPIESRGNRVSTTVARHGITRVKYWATDVAGNANDGLPAPDGSLHQRPGSATVKIDRVPPEVESPHGANPLDPESFQAEVEDPDSGVASASIVIRPAGESGGGRQLKSTFRGGVVSARIPSDDLPSGPYEVSVEATDRVGNARAGFGLGKTQTVNLPMKRAVSLSASFVGKGPGRTSIRSGHGKAVTVTGRLAADGGKPISGATVAVEREFARGSKGTVRSNSVTTDGAGRYLFRLPAGPSSRVSVKYGGNPRDRRAQSRKLSITVRDRVVLRMKPRVIRNGMRVRMRGRVKAKGALRPARGKLVAIQFLDPARRKWRPVEVIRTKPNGRFGYSYRFRTIGHAQRIAFRAVSLPEAGWPYQPSTSRPRSVIVYP